MNMKTKHELQLLHSAHEQLSLSHMPVHVIDYPITFTISQSNYNYNITAI